MAEDGDDADLRSVLSDDEIEAFKEGDLEAFWRYRSRKRFWPSAERPADVRGKELAALISFFHDETNDPAFLDAYRALYRHGILDQEDRFIRSWRGWTDQRFERLICEGVQVYLDHGFSKNAAFREVAATQGIEAASFEAATMQVRRVWEQHAKRDRI